MNSTWAHRHSIGQIFCLVDFIFHMWLCYEEKTNPIDFGVKGRSKIFFKKVVDAHCKQIKYCMCLLVQLITSIFMRKVLDKVCCSWFLFETSRKKLFFQAKCEKMPNFVIYTSVSYLKIGISLETTTKFSSSFPCNYQTRNYWIRRNWRIWQMLSLDHTCSARRFTTSMKFYKLSYNTY